MCFRVKGILTVQVDYRERCRSGCFETRKSSDSYFGQQVWLQWRFKPSVFKVAVRGSIPKAGRIYGCHTNRCRHSKQGDKTILAEWQHKRKGRTAFAEPKSSKTRCSLARNSSRSEIETAKLARGRKAAAAAERGVWCKLRRSRN